MYPPSITHANLHPFMSASNIFSFFGERQCDLMALFEVIMVVRSRASRDSLQVYGGDRDTQECTMITHPRRAPSNHEIWYLLWV